jgi:hypothetical protein
MIETMPMMSSHTPRNRMRDLRMRDGARWTLVYREKAWEQAIAEARRRSFLSNLYYAISWIAPQIGRADHDER